MGGANEPAIEKKHRDSDCAHHRWVEETTGEGALDYVMSLVSQRLSTFISRDAVIKP